MELRILSRFIEHLDVANRPDGNHLKVDVVTEFMFNVQDLCVRARVCVKFL
jgi:hypothetical protein